MKEFLDYAFPLIFGAAVIFALFKIVQKKGFMGKLNGTEGLNIEK